MVLAAILVRAAGAVQYDTVSYFPFYKEI